MPYEADVTLTSKGQLTLPAELRRFWKLQAGDKLHVIVQPDGTALVRPRKPRRFLDYVNARDPHVAVRPIGKQAIEEAIKATVSERYRRGLGGKS